MSDEIHIKNLAQVLSAIKNQEGKMESAANYGVQQVAVNLVYETQKLLNNNPHSLRGKTWYPKGHIGGDGTPPNRRSGHLRDSFQINPVSGFPGYAYKVFPTMVYARSLELGNPKWKSGARYPYLEPSARKVRAKANKIFLQAFLSRYKG
jgi:hypothetical protein